MSLFLRMAKCWIFRKILTIHWFEDTLSLKPSDPRRIALSINLDDGEGNAEADLIIELDLDMVSAIFLKLHTAKEMDIGGMGVEIGEGEGNLSLSDGLILLGIVDEAFLNEVTTAATPPRPEAEFEKSNRELRCRDHAEHTDKCLLTTDLSSYIFAENGSLQIGKDIVVTHGWNLIVSQVFPEGKGSVEKSRW